MAYLWAPKHSKNSGKGIAGFNFRGEWIRSTTEVGQYKEGRLVL